MQPPASINPAPSPPQLKTVDSTKLPPLLRGLRESQSYPQLPRFPEDVPASFGGHGTLEALDVTNLLEREGIVAAVCGVSALKYYGASRLRQVLSTPQNPLPPPKVAQRSCSLYNTFCVRNRCYVFKF